MTISENVDTFAGLPVITVEGEDEFPTVEGPVAWRSAFDFDGPAPAEALPAWFARVPAPETVTALLIGPWAEAYENSTPVAQIAAAGERFPHLKHLFVAEMTFEENEISWINHENFDPLLAVWANRLETLRVRGSNNLTFTPFSSTTLKELAFESGGLPGSIVASVAGSTLPALTHLEFWLGDSNYGYSVTTDELSAALSGTATPALRHLGVRNSPEPLRDLEVIAASPLLGQLETLDLSLGVLGAECLPLLTGGGFSHLRSLDISHHFLGDEQLASLRAALPNTTVTADEQGELDDDEADSGELYAGRYVSVSE